MQWDVDPTDKNAIETVNEKIMTAADVGEDMKKFVRSWFVLEDFVAVLQSSDGGLEIDEMDTTFTNLYTKELKTKKATLPLLKEEIKGL